MSDFIFYFGIITGFSNWIMSLVYSYSNIERCCNDCEAYRNFVEDADPSPDSGRKAAFHSVDSITFQSVFFRYPEADGDTICDMSFTVNKGENIAIVGENGAGKTTAASFFAVFTARQEAKLSSTAKTRPTFPVTVFFRFSLPFFRIRSLCR